MVVAAHRSAGHAGALRVFRGLLPALWGFALFCAAVALLLPAQGPAVAFCVGLTASVASQALTLRLR
jgi:hypothetical protein